jgi:hypothetical protein
VEQSNVIIKSRIYTIDNKIHVPVLYYEGDMNKLYQPNGQGSMYKCGVSEYRGIFEKGSIVSGVHFYNDGDISYIHSYIHYKGTFKNNAYNGEGILYNKKGKEYEGQFVNSKCHGYGISYWESTGAKNWEGEWYKGLKHGKGYLYDDTGSLISKCVFENNELISLES